MYVTEYTGEHAHVHYCVRKIHQTRDKKFFEMYDSLYMKHQLV